MKVEQIYTGCIAHAAYYIENNGEAAIFDPLREVGPYIDRATADGAQIKYIFETKRKIEVEMFEEINVGSLPGF